MAAEQSSLETFLMKRETTSLLLSAALSVQRVAILFAQCTTQAVSLERLLGQAIQLHAHTAFLALYPMQKDMDEIFLSKPQQGSEIEIIHNYSAAQQT